jgi:hypothetical protein
VTGLADTCGLYRYDWEHPATSVPAMSDTPTTPDPLDPDAPADPDDPTA